MADCDRLVTVEQIIDIFEFLDYRGYLRRQIEFLKNSGTSNLSKIAAAIGVHPSYLGHVIAGIKNLNFDQAKELADVLKMTPLEQEYFFTLVHLDRAGTQKTKKYWLDKKEKILAERSKVKSRVGEHTELSDHDRAIFYSSWIYVAVFSSTFIDDGQSLDQIANRFNLSRLKTEEILDFLVRAGICERKGIKYKPGTTFVYIANDSPLVVKHHTNWRMKAIQKMDSRETRELFFTSPMSMSLEDLAKIREILSKSIERSLEICKASPAKEVVCLNIDLFRLTTDSE